VDPHRFGRALDPPVPVQSAHRFAAVLSCRSWAVPARPGSTPPPRAGPCRNVHHPSGNVDRTGPDVMRLVTFCLAWAIVRRPTSRRKAVAPSSTSGMNGNPPPLPRLTARHPPAGHSAGMRGIPSRGSAPWA
jgi:hypothetical protein